MVNTATTIMLRVGLAPAVGRAMPVPAVATKLLLSARNDALAAAVIDGASFATMAALSQSQ